MVYSMNKVWYIFQASTARLATLDVYKYILTGVETLSQRKHN